MIKFSTCEELQESFMNCRVLCRLSPERAHCSQAIIKFNITEQYQGCCLEFGLLVRIAVWQQLGVSAHRTQYKGVSSFSMLHQVSAHPTALGGGPEVEASITKEKSQLWLTRWNLPESARDSHENTAPGAFCGLHTRELPLLQAGLTHQGHHLAS